MFRGTRTPALPPPQKKLALDVFLGYQANALASTSVPQRVPKYLIREGWETVNKRWGVTSIITLYNHSEIRVIDV
jgi:hypothetical protein